jgi:hypothetical protein
MIGNASKYRCKMSVEELEGALWRSWGYEMIFLTCSETIKIIDK